MSILVKCSACQAKLSAPDSVAGNKVKCPKCGSHVAVPACAAEAVALEAAKKPDTAAASKAQPVQPSNDPLRTTDHVPSAAAGTDIAGDFAPGSSPLNAATAEHLPHQSTTPRIANRMALALVKRLCQHLL